ncbi:MAG: TrmH family RNA methyltransferase [Bacteroidetes bacterium]|nr:TrmH family RNA methyltransferase [Bacteroidota bacterium]
MRKLNVSELQRKSLQEFKQSAKIPVILVLDNVRSLYNVGVVFRSADAFAAAGIYLCGITPAPPHRSIEKTALGATRSVTWKKFATAEEALMNLKSEGFLLMAIEQTDAGINLIDFKPEREKKYAFVFGNEIKGISQEALQRCDGFIAIPQFGTKHSLNIAMTATIILWDFVSKNGNING